MLNGQYKKKLLFLYSICVASTVFLKTSLSLSRAASLSRQTALRVRRVSDPRVSDLLMFLIVLISDVFDFPDVSEFADFADFLMHIVKKIQRFDLPEVDIRQIIHCMTSAIVQMHTR